MGEKVVGREQLFEGTKRNGTEWNGHSREEKDGSEGRARS